MFAGAFHGLGRVDPDEERDPPPPPTPVTFPQHVSFHTTDWNAESPPPDFLSLFSRVRQPSDISAKHAVAFNINVLSRCPVRELVPLGSDGTSYLPSLEQDNLQGPTTYADAAKSDSPAFQRQKGFQERIAELRIPNQRASAIINREVKAPDRPERLVHLRQFYLGLTEMTHYWDTSKDQYFDVQMEGGGEKSPKRQKLESDASLSDSAAAVTNRGTTVPLLSPAVSRDASSSVGGRLLDQAAASALPASPDDAISEASPGGNVPEERTRLRYKGCRTSTGSKMPDHCRADTCRAFLSAVAWPFKAASAPQRFPARLQLGRLIFPVRETSVLFRAPKDYGQARSGWLEGPILGLQTRVETEFARTTAEESIAAAQLDLLREFGELLHLAQERHRERKQELKPGEGKWWTSEKRWGGGPGGEFGGEVANVEGEKKKDDCEPRFRERRAKRPSPAETWKQLKCGTSMWEPKRKYVTIGKESDSDYDQIFLVSSLCHHIAVVKLTVHSAYLDCIESGTLPDPLPEDVEWCRPKLERSQWYDLFSVDDRLEVFRALWGIMAYLMRGSDAEPAQDSAPAQQWTRGSNSRPS